MQNSPDFYVSSCCAPETIGSILNDLSKSDGTPRKLLDVSKLSGMGWKARMGLGDGIDKAYEYARQLLEN
ncbi:hypothetical protein LJC48_07810 [Desulfovibrio sp. OttesenSCG-928-C06]|nr:hypothetical protein [Desulfovibrio sp. OttesenSCG-928-C06]